VVDFAAAFLERWQGGAPTATAALRARLDELIERSGARWPTATVSPVAFVAYLAERTATDVDALAALGRLRAEDLYLACACAAGCAHALRCFETELLPKISAHLARIRPQQEFFGEVTQLVREKLFVPSPAGPPKILQYGGHGALESWLRMVALRTALNLVDAERRHQPLDADLTAALPAGSDPEMDYLKAHHRAAFVTAFRGAFTRLSQRERSLLRFQYLDELTPDRIGRIYQVHRTTAMRWISAAQEQLLTGTRGMLIEALALSSDECDDMLQLVRSRLEVTLHQLLRSPSA
jgi:RNA polymerase sigma-70 factor (ECF subfamily)